MSLVNEDNALLFLITVYCFLEAGSVTALQIQIYSFGFQKTILQARVLRV